MGICFGLCVILRNMLISTGTVLGARAQLSGSVPSGRHVHNIYSLGGRSTSAETWKSFLEELALQPSLEAEVGFYM